ncbi:MAG: type II toxin-antitoxin system PemK/MazF family toxin [Spirochaetaceae bacterium]|jgi:mRNA-degrading endonuclease toxin of MazEF toxin-antitoxin module|nr:type II toxin-antitoxin system PemK/MazF family toxin [Spirochaetaceae bacterium]
MVKQRQIIWLDFHPQIGHEQKGIHPALVVSNESFNKFSNLAIVCPMNLPAAERRGINQTLRIKYFNILPII